MLILASSSPRRRELLAQAGLAFIVEPSDIDEELMAGEAAAAFVQRLALEKAQAVCALHISKSGGSTPCAVLAADTAVVLPDGTVLGKPTSPIDATRMLTLLSGRTHAVMTGLAVVTCGPQSRTLADVEITQVTVNLISQDEIASYVATGEPLDKAGAYAIQGYAARWIPRVEGDYFNVVGLPIARVVSMLSELGISTRADRSSSI